MQELERAEAATIVDLVEFDEANLTGFLGYSSLVRDLVHEAGRSNQDALRLARLVRHSHRFPLTLADKADPSRAFDNRGLTIQRGFDGSGKGHFNLDAIATELLEQALDTPDSCSSVAQIRSLRQRRADALLDMAANALSCGGDRSTNDRPAHDSAEDDCSNHNCGDPRSARTHATATVDVVIDLNSLENPRPGSVAEIRAELASGTPISNALIEQLLYDASYRRLLMDGSSVVLDHGTTTRAISPALVCRHHHTLIHQAGWHLGRDPTTGNLTTTSP